MEKNSEDPQEAYRLWSYEKPPKGINVIRGKYWQSSQFTKEYIVYLELNAPTYWRKEFIRRNNLIPNTIPVQLPGEAPSWFQPSKGYKVWVPSDFSQGSKYYEDTTSGHMFFYEIQL